LGEPRGIDGKLPDWIDRSEPVAWKRAGEILDAVLNPVLAVVEGEVGHRMHRAEWEVEERIREDAKNLILPELAKELLLEQEE
jgi:hypothetical protein